ncbi:hypothetical protein [Parageobacillus thermoglucosidasius]|uniref:hypothetical protein n=1 Tax=Parageobacillus thermoglucosidasius TaxID=1426 RepID=UPI000F616A5A|nr:hypothetical protein [Parageobacillus thermoglucosidasius]
MAGQKAQETETWDSRTVVFAHSVMAPSCHPAGGLRGSVWPFAKMAGRWRRPVIVLLFLPPVSNFGTDMSGIVLRC